MYKFKNKQTGVIVEALEFDPGYEDMYLLRESRLKKFLENTSVTIQNTRHADVIERQLLLYGSMIVQERDYIVKDEKGFFFPITKELLFRLYEVIDEPADFKLTLKDSTSIYELTSDTLSYLTPVEEIQEKYYNGISTTNK